MHTPCPQERERLQAVAAKAGGTRNSFTTGAVSLHGDAELSADPPSQTADGGSAATEEGMVEHVPVPQEPAAAQDAAGAPPQQAAPPRPPLPPEPPRMALQKAVALVQAAERGRQARERVAALQLARRRDDARQRIRAAGTVGLIWGPSRLGLHEMSNSIDTRLMPAKPYASSLSRHDGAC